MSKKTYTLAQAQAIFATANKIYKIKNDINLANGTLTIPSGCTLDFQGGVISNGTINLNSDCEIIGSGLNCYITNPSTKEMPLSCYLSDVSNPTLNHSVIQTLITAGAAIIDDIPSIELSNYLSVTSRVIIRGKGKRKTLTFPNSRGFVWNGTASASSNNYVENLKVESLGTSFDFVNSGDEARPANVYFSTFENLNVKSTEGDCFSAYPDNAGSGTSSCVFDNQFRNIYVSATSGCGFNDINGNTMRFEKIRSGSCGTSVFKNCAGVFEQFNGTWGTTNTVFKATATTQDTIRNFYCIFSKCNFESYKSVLFDCNDSKVVLKMDFEQCTFYVTPNANSVVDYFPMNFFYLNSLVWRANTVYLYNNGTYDTGKAFWNIERFASDTNYSVDTDMDVYYSNSTYHTTMVAEKCGISNGIAQTQYNKFAYKEFKNLKAETLNVDTLWQNSGTLEISTIAANITLSYPFYSCLNITYTDELDIDSVHNISYITLYSNFYNSTVYNQFPSLSFYVRNAATNRTIVLKHNIAYGGRFRCSTASNVTLTPGDVAKLTYIPTNISGRSVVYYYVEPIDMENKSGTTSDRPTTNIYVGYEYFDTTLNKPVYWNGSAWVTQYSTTEIDTMIGDVETLINAL